MTVLIRDATTDDADAVAAIVAEANPQIVVTPEGWLHRRRTTPERARRRSLVAEVDGVVVGRGDAGLNPHTTTPGAAHGGVAVLSTHRHRGIGTALVQHLESHLRDVGAVTWTTMFDDDAEAVSFARRHGFVEERVAVASAVDPRTVDPPSGAFEIVPVDVIGAEATYAVDMAAAADEPLADPPAPYSFEEWRDEVWDYPPFTSEGSFAALVDGVPASIALLFVAPALGRVWNAFAATRPEFRGRGLALAAKRAALRWAAEQGFTRVSTGNDETNAPMLAINRRLGYQPTGRVVTYRRRL
jgi:GNAT superfamily N-acetyltransferase